MCSTRAVCATGLVKCPAQCPQGLAMGHFPSWIPCSWREGSCLPAEDIELGDSVNPRRGTATAKLQQFCTDKTRSANHGSRPQNMNWCLFFVLEQNVLWEQLSHILHVTHQSHLAVSTYIFLWEHSYNDVSSSKAFLWKIRAITDLAWVFLQLFSFEQ